MTRRQQKATAVHEIHAGERVGGYRVGKLLHRGGMARLYRVTAVRGRAPLVMKVPRLEADSPLSALPAFENELRILKRLHGPHVPRLVAAGDLARSPFLVMEYLPDARLERAAAQAPLPVDRLRELMIPVCRAVQEVHRQNVIHLDLNPRNIRFRHSGEAVLIDFGIAHHAALPDLLAAAFGEDEGTAAYIAPEQVRYVRHESRSDIYALGVILYQLATGRYPFGRPNLLSVRRRLCGSPCPPRAWNREVPPWLQEVILRCLETRPGDRYATARQVAHALAHPESVTLTGRARETHRVGPLKRLGLCLRSFYLVFDDGRPVPPAERARHAPQVLVALDLPHAPEALRQAMRNAVRRYARAEPHAQFTCLTVMAGEALAEKPSHRRRAADLLAEMRHWARPLHLPPERLVYQVLPGRPVQAILRHARTHLVDHIIVGARSSSARRRLVRGVAAKVVAKAHCTVTVARSRPEALPPRRRTRAARRH